MGRRLFLPAALQERARSRRRILYLEDPPRYDYRFLRNALLKDSSIALRSFLASAEPDWEQPASGGETPLTRETTLSALRGPARLESFDVVLWGDLDLDPFTKDPELHAAIAGNLRRFAASGKGLLFLAGTGYARLEHPGEGLEELLPIRRARPPQQKLPDDPEVKRWIDRLADESVEVREQAEARLIELGSRSLAHLKEARHSGDPEIRARARSVIQAIYRKLAEKDGGTGEGRAPRRLRRTEAARGHPALQVPDGETWTRAPAIRWWLEGFELRPGAETLVETEQKDPILVVRPLERGRVALLATDEWWLWRFQRGDADYYATYRALIDWLAGA
ncbi:MAG: hypothetical protein HY716_06515 [Planctomycetes bacterium]|nr:hypothetical protein [Planctomycetota bacterium]